MPQVSMTTLVSIDCHRKSGEEAVPISIDIPDCQAEWKEMLLHIPGINLIRIKLGLHFPLLIGSNSDIPFLWSQHELTLFFIEAASIFNR